MFERSLIVGYFDVRIVRILGVLGFLFAVNSFLLVVVLIGLGFIGILELVLEFLFEVIAPLLMSCLYWRSRFF